MKKSIASLLFCFTFFVNAQEIIIDSLEIKTDTIVYNKNLDISEVRTFKSNLNEKYKGKDFKYTEELQEKKDSSTLDLGILNFFVFFMQSIFPFLLGGFIIFLILKTVLGFDAKFWKTSKKSKKLTDKLIYENEDIHELNLEELLKQALENKNFRLAIRYYYLTSLKSLSNRELIEYHKDKTNSEYLFEIKNAEIRNQFSYLSYVYSYVWYGEFPVDETSFAIAQNKYQSFLKNLI
ncbi:MULTISPECIES: hypothetical protein [unclassified Polaribacter]|uniref:hypothetical protein n=1 Tax=unclassified Polaribacter TaxID=196858 RepID=UPI0011BDBD89|nr:MULTISPECIES: hypothetical protein [unclassified Polaribacter]TXD50713.1 hypothetical protein ES043_15085 [Polaribacter sp. IC063]TXD58278.1 hypothetical protein ES044_12675 [Polaribacter sp. IC066]